MCTFFLLHVCHIWHMSLHNQFSWTLPTCSTSAMAGARNPGVPICILHLKLGIFKFSHHSTTCHPGGMGSDFPKSQLPFSTLNWSGMIYLWRILTNGDRRRDQQIPSLFQTSVDFSKALFHRVCPETSHMATHVHRTQERQAVSFRSSPWSSGHSSNHHSALASYPSPPRFCFPWTCAFQ